MRHWLIGLVALTLATAAPAQTVGGGVAPPCERACLTGLGDRYLAALVAVEAMGASLPYGTLGGWGE